MLRFGATETRDRRKKPSFAEKTRFPFTFCTFFLYEPYFFVHPRCRLSGAVDTKERGSASPTTKGQHGMAFYILVPKLFANPRMKDMVEDEVYIFNRSIFMAVHDNSDIC